MHIPTIRVAAIGIGLAAFTVPSPAPAQSSPIAVSSCTVMRESVVRQHPFWYPWGPALQGVPIIDGLQIAYTNVSPKVADRVAFAVNYRGDRQRVIDVGTFSPNAPITHQFGTFSGDAYVGATPNVCRAIAVRFTDGTTWHAAGVRRATL
jgi:hypothetical protein